ncbi:xanthine dehydrogenase family protein subunit M [Halolamina litorea]|uniref:FAD binding domain-containing protein n=1 Tax=Halolamina litorea TaxID=1515593 RepID=A0ABD6BNB6_9EURY|nr:FAD binding domain-containing protein [Halolamina litorea]
MIPPQFDYERPTSLDAALDAVAPPDAVPLAGGHDLIPMLKARSVSPGTVVDLGGLDELRGVERVADEGDTTTEQLSVGALTTDADLLDAAPTGADALLDATRAVGDAQIRNRGTVGGNLAAAHPASDIPAATLAADATLHLVGPDGDREVSAEGFATGDHETVRASDELLTRISVPLAPDAGSAYARKTHPSTGYAAVGVAARLRVVDGVVIGPRVAAVGLCDAPTRLAAVEDRLAGADAGAPVEAVESATTRAGDGVDAPVREDHIVSADQRRALLPKYAEQAVSEALARAVGREGVVA